MVGDAGDGVGGFGAGANLPPSPGKTGSNLELLTDPAGVDFRPYLIRVLAMVRRNWFAVLPESARMGNQRGRVLVQFSIDRAGKVPKLVISVPSGSQPLDRAAVAGISASNPFPPLPAEFKGEQIRLQFTFSYNMNVR
jgi:TonB family protein